MNKQEEIKLLKTTVDSWPVDSYLKIPLSALIAFCEREITSDIEPDLIEQLKDIQATIKGNEEYRLKLRREIAGLEDQRRKILADVTTGNNLLNSIERKAKDILAAIP